MTANLTRGQDCLGREMRHLAKTLRQLAAHRDGLNVVDVLTLTHEVRDLQRHVYDLAERLDVLGDPS